MIRDQTVEEQFLNFFKFILPAQVQGAFTVVNVIIINGYQGNVLVGNKFW